MSADTSVVDLRQDAGSWMANPVGDAARARFRSSVPVLRVWQESGTAFDAETGVYHATARPLRKGGKPDWWNIPGKAVWKDRIVPGSFVAVRDGAKGGAAGHWYGLFRVGAVDVRDETMEVRLDPKPVAQVTN